MAVVVFLTVPMGRNPGGSAGPGPPGLSPVADTWPRPQSRERAPRCFLIVRAKSLLHAVSTWAAAGSLETWWPQEGSKCVRAPASELEATTLTVLVGHSGPPHVWGVGGRVPGELTERGLGHGHLLCAVLGTEEPGAGGADALHCGRSGRRGGTAWAGTTVFSPDGGRVGHTGRAEE